MKQNNNTQQTDRERALAWWDGLNITTKARFCSSYLDSGSWNLVPDDDIEKIWRSETQSPTPLIKGEGDGDKVMTKDDWVKAYKDCSDLFLLTVKEAANFKKERDELSNVLKEIVKDWVGEGNFRDIPVLKTQNDTSAGEFKYWTPAAKMVKSELIDKAIEVLKKANPAYTP